MSVFTDVTLDALLFTRVFMPPYYDFGGWSIMMARFGKLLALIASFYWCLPQRDLTWKGSFIYCLCGT